MKRHPLDVFFEGGGPIRRGSRVSYGTFVHIVEAATSTTKIPHARLVCTTQWHDVTDWVAMNEPATCLECVAKEVPRG